MSKSESNHRQLFSPLKKAVDLSMLFWKNGKSSELKPSSNSVPVECKFKSEKEFIELVLKNSKMLFGENTLLIDATESMLRCHLVLDFSKAEKHKLYFVDITRSSQSFWELFARITRLFTIYNFPDFQNRISEFLCGIVNDNRVLKEELNSILASKEMEEYFKVLLISKPSILLLTDQERPELIEISLTYSSNWGKYVKPILVKKYDNNGELFCTMSPAFVNIDSKTNGKTEKASKVKQVKSTEADHFENVSEVIRNVYKNVKTELLKEDGSIEFNPKQYYISMRKKKNLAFFHIGRKRISLVVLNPEENTRLEVPHHEVRMLTEKVQKFWNGPSCTIMVDNMDNLDEVISLLKILIQKQG